MIVYQTPGLSGLELWHGVAERVTLFQLRESKLEYFQGLRDFLLKLQVGAAVAADAQDTWSLQTAAGFERAIFCGGEAQHALLEHTLRQITLPFAFEIDHAGEFAARRGALRLFEEFKWQRGVALDLGQTQLKVITSGTVCSIARDPEWLPFGRHALDPGTGRARLRDFIRRGLATVEAGADGFVLALPVALDEAGVARYSTYPGLWGPVEPIFADLFPAPWVVMNDAVLAAAGFEPVKAEKTLVITLGFGVGGAVWDVPKLSCLKTTEAMAASS